MLKYNPLVALGNCVTVARQTLTLFVGVRIPIPQPKIIVHPLGWAIIFCFVEAMYRDSNQGGLPKANCNEDFSQPLGAVENGSSAEYPVNT